MKNIAIIQARMGSTRLPGKSLLPINGVPIIEWILKRLEYSQYLNNIIFAIPDTKKDDLLYEFLLSRKANIFRGSESDVLTRFYLAASHYDGDNILRICADNPFIDSNSIEDCTYAYNHIPRNNSYPDGVGAEIVSFHTLETIHNKAKTNEYREHIFNYVWDNPDLFKIRTFNPRYEFMMRPDIRLDIDTIDDYDEYCDSDLSPESEIKDIIAYKDKILSFR